MAFSGCSFTGHRQIKSAHLDNIVPLLERTINYAYEEGCRTFYTGGAVGFDTLAARAVIKFRLSHPDVRLVLCLPCVGQDQGWSEAQKAAYAHTLSTADEVIYARDTYTDGCMRERNFLLANKCDIMIAYVGKSKSGSSQTMRMADSMGKEILNIYPVLEDY
jgi:uncharacterized phage-like protein YoqJ